MATLSISFTESPKSAWGKLYGRPRSRSGGLSSSLLSDALPRAQKNPVEAINCISYLNSYISEAGLHRRTTLPPVIFDLYSPRSDAAEEGGGAGLMAHHVQKRIVEKKKLLKVPEKESKEIKAKVVDSTHVPGTADTQLVAIYPGYDPHAPTPLPHGLDAVAQMRRVAKAQTKLSTKVEMYRLAWNKLFHSSSSRAIFLDYFWWFFLHKYQNDQRPIQDKLFSRIAKHYVKMIGEPVDLKMKDSFFKTFADLIAQCVYSALMFAYPNSWINFDEDFKSELCFYINLWQMGTKPHPKSWIKWELRLLEPIDLPKCKANEDEIGVASAGSFDFDTLLKDARIKAAAAEYERRIKASRLSIMEVKNAPLHSREHSADFKKKVMRRNSGRQSLSPEDGRLVGAGMEQPNTSDELPIQLLVPARPNSSPVSPRSKPASPYGHCKDNSDKQQAGPSRESTPKHHARSPTSPRPRSGSSPRPNQSSLRRGSSLKTKSLNTDQRRHSSPRDPQAKGSPEEPTKGSLPEEHGSPRSSPGELRGDSSSAKSGAARRKSSVPSPEHQPLHGRRASIRPGTGTSRGSAIDSETTHDHRKFSATPRIGTASTGLIQSTSIIGAPLVPISHGEKYDGKLKRTAATIKKHEVSATLRGPEFEHVVFNVYGHSPLVKHYMERMNLSIVNEKEIIVGRTEITGEPPPDATCYRDVLIESRVASDGNREQFFKHYNQQRRSMLSANKKRLMARKLHEHNVKLMLAHQKDAQKLKDDLAHSDIKSKIESNKAAATTVIQKNLEQQGANMPNLY